MARKLRLREQVGVVRAKFKMLSPTFNERSLRCWAAAEAISLGHGGIPCVAKATGVSESTIEAGIRELREPAVTLAEGRVRKPGGGRKRLSDADPTLQEDLEKLVEPSTRGDPESPLRWTSKSTANLASELQALGHKVSPDTVGSLLRSMDYSLQALAKTREGKSHPDRDAQFRHISEQTKAFQRRRQPVISVDAKKKELVGAYKNGGQEWQKKGEPQRVHTHDFPDKDVGRARPYGVYDPTRNEGWVSVGKDHDTAEFAVQTIRTWWRQMGREAYPKAKQLLITADAGGSNSYRIHLWKLAIQRLADEEGIEITVCHFPPGTSKWNKIEHRLFSEITKNWRGRPLTSHEVIVNLIASTTTTTGLTVRAKIDPRKYKTKLKVSKDELARLNLHRSPFHGDWNYTIKPREVPRAE
jgi:transposase